MLFSLEALPAQEGDCLLLHWGTVADPRLGVIDGGPGQVYEKHLRPRLEKIREARGGGRLRVDLVMVSHVDNDHVVGIKKMFRQMRDQVSSGIAVDKRLLDVRLLWHNTFNDVLGDDVDAFYKSLTANITASSGGEPTAELVKKLEEAVEGQAGTAPAEAALQAERIAKLLAGHGEGRELRVDYEFMLNAGLIRKLNAPFKTVDGDPTLITLDEANTPRKVEGLHFQIAGPMAAEVQALQKAFDKYLKDNDLSVEAMLAAYTDKSIPNLSSLVCLTTCGDKTILFTGDARGDKIIEGLDKAGLLDDGTLHVDVLKVPHHGSDRNVDAAFFKKITADHYVFSGDGKHANPDRVTLEWLTKARGKTAEYTIHMNHAVDSIDTLRKADYQKHNKVYSQATDGLAELFADREDAGYAFELKEDSPALIELGDEKIAW